MKKILASILLVPSLALAQPGAYYRPPPPPLSAVPPCVPIIAVPANGYMVWPTEPERPTSGRHIAGGVTIAAGLGLALLGGLLMAGRQDPPPLGAPGWYDAQTSYDGRTAGGIMMITTGAMAVAVGGLLLAVPDRSYREYRGSPNFTF